MSPIQAENDHAFGRPGSSRGSSAFPKIRFVALLENGTHVLWGAHMDQYATNELTLAEKVIPWLGKGMLCMADPFFPRYKLWRAAAKTGADLVRQEFFGLLMAHFAIRGLMDA